MIDPIRLREWHRVAVAVHRARGCEHEGADGPFPHQGQKTRGAHQIDIRIERRLLDGRTYSRPRGEMDHRRHLRKLPEDRFVADVPFDEAKTVVVPSRSEISLLRLSSIEIVEVVQAHHVRTA